MAKRILVVDDERSQREVLEMILSSEGYEITTVESGEAALQLYYSNYSFDLVLTDLKLQGMNGIELLTILKECDPQSAVIILTAHSSVESALEALRRGAADYLEKPFDRSSLIKAIQTVLTEKETASPLKKVFLSHSHHDKPFTRALARSLRNHGIKVWLDEAEINIGESVTLP